MRQDLQAVVTDAARSFAVEVEVGMVGEVDDGRLVGGGRIANEQVFASHFVGDVYVQITWETLLSIGREVVQLDGVRCGLDDIPDLIVETVLATMEGIFAMILSEVVGGVIYVELCTADAPCSTSVDAVEVDFLGEPLVKCGKAQYYIVQLALYIGYPERNDLSTVVGDLYG